jgi:hypothetical protein
MSYLIQILISFAGSLFARLILGAGLSVFTYTQIDSLVADIQMEIGSLLGGLPADLLGLISIMKIPQAISIVISALGLAAFIKASKIFIGRAN